VLFWYGFGLVLASGVREQRQNSAILAQASPSRLSESCRSLFRVLVLAFRSGDQY